MRRFGLLLALFACGGKDDGDGTTDAFPRACDQSTTDGDCVYYSGEEWLEEDVLASCVGGSITGQCPPGGAVGSCTLDSGPFETVSTFYSPFWTAPAGVQACQAQGGAWSEP